MAANYDVPPVFPERLHIQTISYCNARCVFCAYPQVKNTISHGIMDDALYARIIDEAAPYRLKRVALLLMNEPLLDRKLPERIAYAKQKMGAATEVTITSNGSILTPKIVERLLDSGLDRIKISVEGLTRETYERVMGLDFQRTMDGINRLIEARHSRAAAAPKLVLSMVNIGLNEQELRRYKRYWKQRGVKATFVAFENKGGNVRDDESLHPFGLTPFKRCYRFNRCAYILYNGDMIPCCADWSRTVVLGNVRDSSIRDLFHGETLTAMREHFRQGAYDRLPLMCRNCKRTKLASRSHRSLTGLYQRCLSMFSKRASA
jgi:MoaA/NifB/PqqE/SkfB family radical SAM enzyme